MKKRLIARSAETRVRILDAAESLFADKGLEATSMRALTTLAKVNLAAVNYHFGSKEGLIVAVFARRLGPVNHERLTLLEALERRGKPTIESILEAFVAPVLRLIHDRQRGGDTFMRLLGRALYEPGSYLTQLFREEVEPVLNRFTFALQRVMPRLSNEDLFWRMHFGGGALAYTLAQVHRMDMLSKGVCDPNDVDAVTARLVDFIAAGMQGTGHARRVLRKRERAIAKAQGVAGAEIEEAPVGE
jgi:AcrR family transcriptional regulator